MSVPPQELSADALRLLAPLREALSNRLVKEAYENIARRSSVLFLAVTEVLLKEESSVIDVELALEISRVVAPATPRLLELVTPFGSAALPYLEEEAARVRDGLDGVAKQRVVGLLGLCSEHGLDEKHDALLMQALRHSEKSSIKQLVPVLRQVLATLPVDRRERLILSELANEPGDVLWSYASLAPTPRVLSAALRWLADLSIPRDDPEASAVLQRAIDDALHAFDRSAASLFEAWLASEGKKSPHRGSVIRALADLGAPEATATLLSIVRDDRDGEVKETARAAVLALGDAALQELKAAGQSEDVKTRELAEQLMASIVAPSDSRWGPKPATVMALETLRAATTDADRDACLALLAADYWKTQEQLRPALESNAGLTLVTLFDHSRAVAAREQKLVGFDDVSQRVYFADAIRTCMGRHEALPALFAELLCLHLQHPKMSASRWTELYDKLGEGSAPVLDALGFYFERELPPDTPRFVKHILEAPAPFAWERVLVACAREGAVAVRKHAVTGLVRCGQRVVPHVLPLLTGPDGGLNAAAEVLRALPDPSAIAPLEAALETLKKQRGKRTRDALEDALYACKALQAGPEGAPIPDLDLDAQLAERSKERRMGAPDFALPALRWKDGTALSDGAARWLLATLAAEGGAPNVELMTVREKIDDRSAAELFSYIDQSVPWESKHRWKMYAVGILGSARQIDDAGGRLGGLARSGKFMLATDGVEMLRRNGSGHAIVWLDRWTTEGTEKLRQAARVALAQLASERRSSLIALVDVATPHEAEVESAAIAAIRKRLEEAMLVGRTFDRDHFRAFVLDNPLVTKAAQGLVFQGADRSLGVLVGTDFLGAAGAKMALTAPVVIPPPCALEDGQLTTWRAALTSQDLTQPFLQVERPFSRTPDAEMDALYPQPVAVKRLLSQLERLGHRRGAVEDAGLVYSHHRPFGPGWVLVVAHDAIGAGNGWSANGKTKVSVGVVEERRDGSPPDLTLSNATVAMRSEALQELRQLLATP